MIRAYDDYVRVFKEKKWACGLGLYVRFEDWLYSEIKNDIKDSLIVWHDLRENPDDLPKESGNLIIYKYPSSVKCPYTLISSDETIPPDALEWAEIKPPKGYIDRCESEETVESGRTTTSHDFGNATFPRT